MSENQTDWEQWLAEKESSNNKRMEAKLSNQGRSPYLRLEQGENKITLLPVTPIPKTSNWGKEQEIFKVQRDGVEYDWPVTITSPMYIRVARNMPKAPVELTVVRVGLGQQTRLSLIE
ncbi:hypothetical protein ACFL0D_04930 [Thermoproteota archaeon]